MCLLVDSKAGSTRNEILQKRVAQLEKLRQTSKSQTKTLLEELDLREKEAAEAEKKLKDKLAQVGYIACALVHFGIWHLSI